LTHVRALSTISLHVGADSLRIETSVGWGMADRETQDYWKRREQAERVAAKNAASDVVRRVHQELAQGYADRLRNG